MAENNSAGLEKKYGLMTATAMVIGNVIGSGVFFKAEKVQGVTGGNLPTGILAWIIGGLIMVICANVFAVLATRYEKCGGVMDYAEVTVGGKYAYFIGWFMATIYYPTLVSVLGWVGARYFCVLCGWDITGGACLTIAGFFLMFFYVLNVLAPRLAGKFQVSTTVIKLIPLFLMVIFGIISGLKNGILVENFTSGVIADVSGNPLLAAVIATSFAYEGWISATSINAELKNAKRNLPLALTFGTLIVVVVYVLYYIGLAGTVPNADMMAGDGTGVKLAFSHIFKSLGGTLLFVFVIISCLGTLNGMMMGNIRNFYAIASRNQGPKPEVFGQLDSATKMPLASSILGLLVVAFWFLYFVGANLVEVPWFGSFSFDSSEVPAVTTYALYIPIFVGMMMKEKELGAFKRFVLPVLGVIACCMMIAAGIGGYGIKTILCYLVIFAVIMGIGALFMNPKKKN